MTTDQDVVVGVCTFRRPAQLARLLQALADQRRTSPEPLSVVVVDNSPGSEGREVVSAATGLAVTYVPLGAKNISIARNAVLSESRHARFVALLDDDEYPEPTWLQSLLDRQTSTGADIVVGPVLPVFPPGAPSWLADTGAYGVVDLDALAAAQEGITGNVLLSCQAVHRLGLRFDVRLGLSGGEDQLFFRQALAGGLLMAYAPDAVAHEDVPEQRLRARYVLNGEFRRGNTLGLLDRGSPGWPDGRPGRRVAVALWWFGSGSLALPVALVRGDRTSLLRSAARVVRALGMVWGLLGRRYELYATAPTGAASDAAA